MQQNAREKRIRTGGQVKYEQVFSLIVDAMTPPRPNIAYRDLLP